MTEKINNIKKLLNLNGGRKGYEDSVLKIIDAVKHLIPDFNPDNFTKDDLYEIVDEIMEEVIPIYDKYFDNDEILGIIDFYNSDIGKSYLSKMSIVAFETMKVGEKQGEIVYNKLSKKPHKGWQKVTDLI